MSEDTRVVNGYLTYDFADRFGGVNVWHLSLSKGLNGFGSTNTGSSLKLRVNSVMDFAKIYGEIHRQQAIGYGFSAHFNGLAQLAANALPSSERFYLGGAPYNRAYEMGTSSSDSGLFGALGLSYTTTHDYGRTRVYASLTQGCGWTRLPSADEKSFISLSGIEIGIEHSFDFADGYVSYCIPLRKKVLGKKASNKVYAGLKFKI